MPYDGEPPESEQSNEIGRGEIQNAILIGFDEGDFIPHLSHRVAPLNQREKYKEAVRRKTIGDGDYLRFINHLDNQPLLYRKPTPDQSVNHIHNPKHDYRDKEPPDLGEWQKYLIGVVLRRPVGHITKTDFVEVAKDPMGQNIMFFEQIMRRVSLQISADNPSQAPSCNKAVQTLGEAIFGRKWDYLQEFRILEWAAKAEHIISQVTPRNLASPNMLRQLVPAHKAYIEEQNVTEAYKQEQKYKHEPSTAQISEAVRRGALLAKCYERSVEQIVHKKIPATDLYKTNADLLDILLKRELEGKGFYPYDNIAEMVKVRSMLAEMYINNTDFVRDMAAQGIEVGHGSGSASLLGFSKHGLRPQAVLTEAEQVIAGGEGVFGAANLNQEALSTASWTSFADPDIRAYVENNQPITVASLQQGIFDIEHGLESQASEMGWPSKGGTQLGSYRHSGRITVENMRKTINLLQKPDKTEDEQLEAALIGMNFPVLYLIPHSSLEGKSVIPTRGIDAEIAYKGGFSKDEVGIIAVPKNRVVFTRNVLASKGVHAKVYPLEDYSFEPYKGL